MLFFPVTSGAKAVADPQDVGAQCGDLTIFAGEPLFTLDINGKTDDTHGLFLGRQIAGGCFVRLKAVKMSRSERRITSQLSPREKLCGTLCRGTLSGDGFT